MRTTVSLPNALLERAKRQAEAENVTLSQLVEMALRERLTRRHPAPEPVPFRLVTFGGRGLAPGVAFDRLGGVADDEDVERLKLGRSSRAADGDADAPARR